MSELTKKYRKRLRNLMVYKDDEVSVHNQLCKTYSELVSSGCDELAKGMRMAIMIVEGKIKGQFE